MRRCVLLVLPLILSTMAIKVPVDNSNSSEDNASDNLKHSTKQTPSEPIYYTSDEPVDSYLIPPDPHKPEEVLPDTVVKPATYLLPPAENQQSDYYYAPVESDDQSDWYPIAQQPPVNQQGQLLPPRQQTDVIPIFLSTSNQSKTLKNIKKPRAGKVLGDRFNTPLPSVKLEPPAEDAPNEFIIRVPSEELELPAEEIDHPYHSIESNSKEVNHQPIVSHRAPPKSHLRKYKNPTKLYPKKFKPVPIPIGQFAEDSLEVPKAKPVRHFKPLPGIEDALAPTEDKIYLFDEVDQKRKPSSSQESQEQQVHKVSQVPQSEKYEEVPPTELDASESYRYPERNVYSAPYRGPVPYRGQLAPLRVAPTAAPAPLPQAKPQPQAPPAPDDRTEFRMHGMKGPHSYQFGYDTGKGKNRQFRYEERDNDGLVKGHYGYMDKHGKLRVVNYSAHPEHGFQAQPEEEVKE